MVRCDASAPYDPAGAAFASRGMAVERLGWDLERRPERLLQEADRFLTLARLAPGAIAMHGPGAGLGRGGEVLAAALLVKRHGFRARAALAWLRITHPAAAHRRELRFSALPAAAAAAPPRDANAADPHRLPAGDSCRWAALPRRCAPAPTAAEGQLGGCS